jgi:hypothetical protein
MHHELETVRGVFLKKKPSQRDAAKAEGVVGLTMQHDEAM